jgi:hypothetical protein
LDRPPLSPDLAQAVSRLWQVREELKRLETEEAALRDGILAAVEDWPDSWFPVNVGGHELRRSRRPGRLDATAALDRLAALGLMPRVPLRPTLANADAAVRFGERVKALRLGAEATARVLALYGEAVALVPDVNADLLRAWRSAGTLTESEYRACFRDAKPDIPVLAVR